MSRITAIEGEGRKSRTDTKQARLITMLEAPEGASVKAEGVDESVDLASRYSFCGMREDVDDEYKATYRREGPGFPSDLTDAEWAVLSLLIPEATPGGRPHKTDMRQAMNAIFYLLRTGSPWHYLPRDEPMAVRRGIDQALASGTPAVLADHVGRGAGLVEENEGGRVHEALPQLPQLAPRRDVGAILLGRPQRLFLCVRPSLPSIVQIADFETAIPREASSALISASVVSLRVAVSSRSRLACAARIGLR